MNKTDIDWKTSSLKELISFAESMRCVLEFSRESSFIVPTRCLKEISDYQIWELYREFSPLVKLQKLDKTEKVCIEEYNSYVPVKVNFRILIVEDREQLLEKYNCVLKKLKTKMKFFNDYCQRAEELK